MVLELMEQYKNSRKFTFNELRRKLGYPMGSLDPAIEQELQELLESDTIGRIAHDYFGWLYYVRNSQQDPNLKEITNGR